MADDQPPWATKKYSTPPSGGDPAGTAPRSDGPDVTKYTTAPPSPPPPPPPSDPFIRDLQDPGFSGSLARGAAGVTQGFILDPAEKIGELTGIGQNPPKWLEDRLEATRRAAGETPMGEAGRITGTVANPLWRLLPEIKAGEYSGQFTTALAKLLSNIYQGTVGGAAQPTGAKTPSEAVKRTFESPNGGFFGPAEIGAITGGVLGLPGTIARGFGFENLQQPVHSLISALPFEFRRVLHLRDLSLPSFTRWWHQQSLEPIGGKLPQGATKETMDKVGEQIGKALDQSTALMSLDTRNPTVSRALAKVRGDSMYNLGSSGTGSALQSYNQIINDVVTVPLVTNAGRLNPATLRSITSNLEARIRSINPGKSSDLALLKRELENYRLAMFDNATGGNKAAYRNAREAWRRHAIGRDSQPLGEESGHLDPDQVAKELDRRNPTSYPYGGPRGKPEPLQRAVNQAQKALLNTSGAARRGKAGRPLREQPMPSGAAGAVANQPPLSYSWPDQNQ